MARIANVNIPDNKQVEIALTYIYGVGRSLSRRIIANAGLKPEVKVKDLNESELSKLRGQVEQATIEGDLAQQIRMNINRLKEIGSYRGTRHKLNLPAHGQRTRTNARTKRGKRQTVGSGKTKAPTPT